VAATKPVAFCLRSVKVVLLMVEAIMSSEKVALTLTEGATITVLALGTVLVTLGGVVPGGERGCQCRLPNGNLHQIFPPQPTPLGAAERVRDEELL
jgi:hypothetical protein